MIAFIVLGVLCLAGAAFLVGEAVTLPARQRRTSVQRAATYGKVRRPLSARQLPFRQRVLSPLGDRLAGWTLKLHPRTTVAGVGFIAPDFVVSGKARSRKDRIRAELPDALDLMAVSVEAGMGFDGAISKLTEHMDGPLAEEFALTLSEIRIGESRQDALKKLAERTGTPELSSFVRSIIQADQLGISLGRILRVQATDSRLKRQAAAEEKAMKAPIKMLFPTVLFIFPAMFLVILGPAFLNLSKIF